MHSLIPSVDKKMPREYEIKYFEDVNSEISPKIKPAKQLRKKTDKPISIGPNENQSFEEALNMNGDI